MGSTRTAWHPAFAALLAERAPANVEVRAEVQLSTEPQKADLLLLRRRDIPASEGRVLRRIWPLLAEHTLVEFKSISRPPRPGDWMRLYGYALQYHVPRIKDVGDATNLSLVLITATMTPTLRSEIRRMRWGLEDLGGGYLRVAGQSYRSFLVLIDEVAEAEKDPLLGAFGRRILKDEDLEARMWLINHLQGRTEFEMKDLEGYQEFVERIRQNVPPEIRADIADIAGLTPEERIRLSGLTPEERVAGLTPEERVAGLTPDETVLLLADEILVLLPNDFVESLPASVRDQVRHRIAAAT